MRYLFTDLDNTLIYSHRWDIGSERVLVEELKGREQSFMTTATYQFLRNLKDTEVVPVTTRTQAQYSRLDSFFQELGCSNALICNGSILLIKGEVDPNWKAQSHAIAGSQITLLQEIYQDFCSRFGPEAVCYEHQVILYAKVEDPAKTLLDLDLKSFKNDLEFYTDARKLYCIPKLLSKGSAVMRYKQKIGGAFAMVAGDSQYDISMLNEADVAIFHEKIEQYITAPKQFSFPNKVFSDDLCKVINSYEKRD